MHTWKTDHTVFRVSPRRMSLLILLLEYMVGAIYNLCEVQQEACAANVCGHP
jgi:hypothetical protein